jgi:hypothetical protein
MHQLTFTLPRLSVGEAVRKSNTPRHTIAVCTACRSLHHHTSMLT